MPSFNSAVLGLLCLFPVLLAAGIYLFARCRTRSPARLAATLLRMPEDKRRSELAELEQSDRDLAYAVKREMHWQSCKGGG